MKHAYLLLALAVSCIVPGVVVADVIGSPELDATIEQEPVTPGEQTDLELTLSNTGQITEGSNSNQQLNDRVTTARGLTVTVDDSEAPIDIDSETRVVGSFPTGTTSIAYSMTVDQDAEPGTYEVPVKLEYRYTRVIGEGSDEGEEQTIRRTDYVDAELKIEDDARLEIVDVSSQARVGSTGTVAVTVENAGTQTAHDTTLKLESRNAALTLGGSSTATRQIGEWAPGERHTVEYRVTAARSAAPQPYAFDATATYNAPDGETQTSETRTLAVQPRKQQTFSVESVESTVAVGDTGTVTVRMRNEGPIAVSDASVKLVSQNPVLRFAGSESASRFAGSWAVGETRTLEYDVTATEDADTRQYALDATVSFQDQEGDSETAPSRTLGVEPDPEQSFAIEDVSSTLRVGSEGKLTGTVRNTGDANVTNAVVVFETDKPNVTPLETEAPVGDLAAGETASFSLPVEISESGEPGPQQYSLVIQYHDGDGDQRTSDTIDVRQEVRPDDRVFGLEVDGKTVTPGGGTVLEVTVTNTGEERLTDISANIFADAPMSADDDEAFIAGLDPGESETVQFSVSAGGGALEKTYPVSLDFQYDEPDGDTKLSNTYEIAVSVAESEDGGGPPVAVIGGAVVILVLIGGYLYVRRQ